MQDIIAMYNSALLHKKDALTDENSINSILDKFLIDEERKYEDNRYKNDTYRYDVSIDKHHEWLLNMWLLDRMKKFDASFFSEENVRYLKRVDYNNIPIFHDIMNRSMTNANNRQMGDSIFDIIGNIKFEVDVTTFHLMYEMEDLMLRVIKDELYVMENIIRLFSKINRMQNIMYDSRVMMIFLSIVTKDNTDVMHYKIPENSMRELDEHIIHIRENINKLDYKNDINYHNAYLMELETKKNFSAGLYQIHDIIFEIISSYRRNEESKDELLRSIRKTISQLPPCEQDQKQTIRGRNYD